METELNSSRQSAIVTYFIDPLIHHYCDFKGTTSRAAYWYFVLFNSLISWAMIGILSLISSRAGIIINSIWSLATLLPCLGIGVRRLHDIGKKRHDDLGNVHTDCRGYLVDSLVLSKEY